MLKTGADPAVSKRPETCEVRGIHRDVVQTVLGRMPEPGKLTDLAEFYKLFGDRTRLRIIWALGISEMCVCDLCEVLRMKQPAISHQLRALKHTRIVKSRREGKVVFYSLDDEHIREVLEVGRKHLEERS